MSDRPALNGGISTMIDRRRVVIHEAGHVLASAALDLVMPDLVRASADHGETISNWDRLRLDDDGLSALAIHDLAGRAAAGEFGLPDPDTGSEHDLRQATGIARYLDPRRPEALLDELREQAEQLVHEQRAAIGRFAETLLGAGRLAGQEVRIALRAAIDGEPTPRFDSGSRFEVMTRTRQIFEDLEQDYYNAEQRAAAWTEAERRARGGEPKIPGPSLYQVQQGARWDAERGSGYQRDVAALQARIERGSDASSRPVRKCSGTQRAGSSASRGSDMPTRTSWDATTALGRSSSPSSGTGPGSCGAFGRQGLIPWTVSR